MRHSEAREALAQLVSNILGTERRTVRMPFAEARPSSAPSYTLDKHILTVLFVFHAPQSRQRGAFESWLCSI